MERMMKRLFVTDLDGTALGGDYPVYARIPECLAETLDLLAENGWAWVVNTTWDVEGQWRLVLNSPLKSRPAYLIGEFGRKIAAVRDGRPVYLQPWCDNNDRKIADFTRRKTVPLMNALNRAFVPEKIHFFGHLFEYTAAAGSEGLEEFAAGYPEEADFHIRIKPGSRTFSIRPAFLGKGAPLREIMKLEHLTPEQVVTAGDEPPDLEMMSPEITACPICPANADEAVKRHAIKCGGIAAAEPFGAGIAAALRSLCLPQRQSARSRAGDEK